MASGFDRFINSILQERTATPLYTTFGISWVLWNWKIVYFTLFVSEDSLPEGLTKLRYVDMIMTWQEGFILPLISTGIFIYVLPYIANATYKQSLKFRAERIKNKSDIIDKHRRLSVEDSAKIMTDANERIGEIEKDNERLRTSRRGFVDELEKVNKESENSRLEALKFRVLYARYGSGPTMDDVKNVLNSKIINETSLSFKVNHDTFEIKDPASTYWKLLLMAFQANGEVRVIKAVEGDNVSIVVTTMAINVGIGEGDRANQINTVLDNAKLPVLRDGVGKSVFTG